VLGVVAVLGQQSEQLGQARRVVTDAGLRQQRPVGVDDRDVVVVLGPVHAAEHLAPEADQLQFSPPNLVSFLVIAYAEHAFALIAGL
jgi:hypothetical protein